MRDFRATAKKCYFVQDFEPSFFAPGSEWGFAEDTYRFGFHGITAGHWLADKLRNDYGMPTDPILLGPCTGLTHMAIIASVSE